ncbi:MAG TPA: hypothetical protein VIU65_01555, partial [Pyrinomonadaceae bacterium]
MRRPLHKLIAITCLFLVGLSGALGARVTTVNSAPAPASEFPANTVPLQDLSIESSDPDRPAGTGEEFDEGSYLRLRDEYFALRRGVEIGRP